MSGPPMPQPSSYPEAQPPPYSTTVNSGSTPYPLNPGYPAYPPAPVGNPGYPPAPADNPGYPPAANTGYTPAGNTGYPSKETGER